MEFLKEFVKAYVVVVLGLGAFGGLVSGIVHVATKGPEWLMPVLILLLVALFPAALYATDEVYG